MQEKSVQSVCARIEAAFRDAQYHGDAIGCDNWEGFELSLRLKRKLWKNLSLDDVNFMSHAVMLMKPEAYRYYLPAYLIFALTEEVEAARYVNHSLILPKEKERITKFLELVEAFTFEQKNAIALYLLCESEIIDTAKKEMEILLGNFGLEDSLRNDYVSDLEKNIARYALEVYWARFL
jgi:hypothetical protein